MTPSEPADTADTDRAPDAAITVDPTEDADWHRRVVGRSLRSATQRSIDRGQALVQAAATVLQRSGGQDITVQDVADEAGQSLRTLYQYFESKDDLLLAVFEESMRLYAKLIRQAVKDLEDPLERLAGAVLAASSMAQFSDIGLDRGLARLRLRLAESSPELVGRSQEAVTELVRELVAAAAEAGRISATDTDGVTFMVLSLNTAYITGERLGNDSGVDRPELSDLVIFCLRGMGADFDRSQLDAIRPRLDLPAPQPPTPDENPTPRPSTARTTAARTTTARTTTARTTTASSTAASSTAARKKTGSAPGRRSTGRTAPKT